MILNKAETKVVASCGWVDRSGLLVIDVRARREDRYKLDGAEYIGLKKLFDDYFLAVQHFQGERQIMSIHSFTQPDEKLAQVTVTSRDLEFRGNQDLWKLAPRYYVAALKDQAAGSDYRLIEINRERRDGLFPKLEWFDDAYDQLYQSVMDVIEIPGTGQLLFSVQRSSEPVLYDLSEKRVVKKIKLSGRCGNPIFSFRNNQKELWCVDYDTLIRMRVSDWKVLAKKRLQGSSFQTDMQFVGGFTFTPDEKYCAVARPFSRDLVLMDCESFKIVAECESRLQPLGVAVLSNLDFIARDWKTGRVEFGSFKIRKGFWPFN